MGEGGSGGGGDVKCQNPKCQDLSKFQFSGVGWGGGGVCHVKCQNPKCQDLSKFQFLEGEGVM